MCIRDRAYTAASSGLRARIQAYSKSYAVTGVPFVQDASRSVKVYVFRSAEIFQLAAIAGCGIFLLSIRVNPSKTCSMMLASGMPCERAGSIVAGSVPKLYVTSCVLPLLVVQETVPKRATARNTDIRTNENAFLI